MIEARRTDFNEAPVRRNEKVCKKSNKGSRIAKALEGTVTLEEFSNMLVQAYYSLHKDETASKEKI